MGDDSTTTVAETFGVDGTASGLGNIPLENIDGSAGNSSILSESELKNDNALENIDGSAEEKEIDQLWSILRVNSLDFNAWTALIEETERVASDDNSKIRRVYDSFLAKFPLCYGYWKKYTDNVARLGSIENVVEIYERAVQGATYSVDMWLHYCIFAASTYEDQDKVHRVFERAVAFVGEDYLSFPIWDEYIQYEYVEEDWARIATIYAKILENPN